MQYCIKKSKSSYKGNEPSVVYGVGSQIFLLYI